MVYQEKHRKGGVKLSKGTRRGSNWFTYPSTFHLCVSEKNLKVMIDGKINWYTLLRVNYPLDPRLRGFHDSSTTYWEGSKIAAASPCFPKRWAIDLQRVGYRWPGPKQQQDVGPRKMKPKQPGTIDILIYYNPQKSSMDTQNEN